jgi:hypothetical protein
MIDITKSIKKSPYFEGRRLPISDLTPSDFEKFVAACLLCIGDAQGIEIQGLPSGSGDGGFDISGKDLRTGRVVCFQCKRQIVKIGIAQVAQELAKVAANSNLEGSDVGQHRFLCTGGITNELITLLRGDFRTRLATEAGDRLATASKGELESLKGRLKRLGEDPKIVVKSYVDRLDKLLVWDQDGFDVALSSRWSSVMQVVEKYFTVANFVREHPRASFDRFSYISTFCSLSVVVRPRFATAKLPLGMTFRSVRDANLTPKRDRPIDDLIQLPEIDEGMLVVLIGDGGVGKTTVLELIRAEVLKSHPDSAIAVLISLANYTPGALDNLIQSELGVDFGSWRTLPDRVVLLFDGLNECPSSFVANFLDDLKIVLRRRLAACIVSTREATRHRSIELPVTPLTCLRVEHITPIAVRRIAKSKLGPEKAKSFEIAYLELANRAHAPHLWTPFALEVGLEYWGLSGSLPTTLGEMIDKLIQSRCEKEASSPSHPVGASVVLALAGALAFVNLIINKRLECAEIEAGKWIRDAKVICEDALGIADMTQLDVIALLKRHELLRLSSTAHYSFGHQLLVGALAAPNLASNWRTYLHSTEEPITDDAWIFAARFIPVEEISEFLEAMFNADLMLGAHVARELPSEYHELAEKFLFRCVENAAPEFVQVRGLFALSLLATPNAIVKIREMSQDHDPDISYRARQALAATGDRLLLHALMPSVETMRAGPGTMSGGDLGIWERAPYSSRLEIAREWLSTCRPGSRVKESLSLIASEQDPNDIGLVERQLVSGMDVSQWAYVLHTFHKLNRARASEVFEVELTSATTTLMRAKLFQIAASIGIPFDLRQAFECALTNPTEHQQEAVLEYELDRLVENVIVKAELPPSLIAFVEMELKMSNYNNRVGRLWSIAASFTSQSIAEIAEARLAAWENDLGYVCNYFIQQPPLAHERKQQILEICEGGLSVKKNWHTWHANRALALVGIVGYSPAIAGSLASMVEQITRVGLAIENNDLPSIHSHDFRIIAEVETEHLEIHLDGLAADLISPAARARQFLTKDVKLAFLHFDMSFRDGVSDDYHELLIDLSNEEVDAVLLGINRVGVRISSLCAACKCAVTGLRINFLAEALLQYAEMPHMLRSLTKAVDACWGNSVSQMVMITVANIPNWNYTQFFWDFADVVANRLGQADREYIDAALLIAKTQFSKKILELWRDKAVGARIGIGRLIAEG